MERLISEQKSSSDGLHISEIRANIQAILHAVHGLTLFDKTLQGSTGQAVLELLCDLALNDPEPVAIATLYSRAFRLLAEQANRETTPGLPDAWQAYLMGKLLDDRNPWSEQVERVGLAHVSPTLRAQAQRDLRTLQRLFQLDAQTIWRLVDTAVAPQLPALRDAWTPWRNLAPTPSPEQDDPRASLAREVSVASDWSTMLNALERYWACYGTGPLARYHVVHWDSAAKELCGVAHPDPIQLSNLIGHERQQERLTTNIRRFLANLPAQDMLLYGPPGTGKSSTIKALANDYAGQGLCLVEVNKEDIADLHLVVSHLRHRAPHYLLFIDDLSFEEHETAYKALKVMLEGTAQARPANVLICVTSNRMNLIRENFSERGKPTEDVNWRDTMDEKQSLAHRFALRVTFISPDQKQYLRIVAELAQQRAINLPGETLQERALKWERYHTGRSGRLARQFIDDLVAELQYR